MRLTIFCCILIYFILFLELEEILNEVTDFIWHPCEGAWLNERNLLGEGTKLQKILLCLNFYRSFHPSPQFCQKLTRLYLIQHFAQF
jgi:hypothetical protein